MNNFDDHTIMTQSLLRIVPVAIALTAIRLTIDMPANTVPAARFLEFLGVSIGSGAGSLVGVCAVGFAVFTRNNSSDRSLNYRTSPFLTDVGLTAGLVAGFLAGASGGHKAAHSLLIPLAPKHEIQHRPSENKVSKIDFNKPIIVGRPSEPAL